MDNTRLVAELRDLATRLRTSSMPLSTVIPLMQKAADALEEQEHLAGLADAIHILEPQP